MSIPHKPKPGRSIAEHNPELIAEWSPNNPYSPYEISYGNNTEKPLWICKEHGEYEMSCNNRSNGQICKYCRRNKVIEHKSTPPVENSLSFLFPDISLEWSVANTRSPDKVYAHSSKPYKWVCQFCGVEWEATVRNRTKKVNPTGCPRCWKERMSETLSTPKYIKSLEYKYMDISKEWSTQNTREPSEVYAFEDTVEYYWTCPNGHPDYKMSCAQRVKAIIGCKICRKYSQSTRMMTPPPFHSFADLYPDLLKEYSPENSRNPYSLNTGADYYAEWVCRVCGYEWKAWVYNRTGPQKTGCPKCFNLSQSTAEELLRESFTHFGALPTTHKIGTWEVDIYFPVSNTVVEYDGSAWHHKPESYERDRRKSLDLLSKGYKVIRIRELSTGYQLKSLEIDSPNYSEIFYENGYHKKYSSEPTEELLSEIHNLLRKETECYI